MAVVVVLDAVEVAVILPEVVDLDAVEVAVILPEVIVLDAVEVAAPVVVHSLSHAHQRAFRLRSILSPDRSRVGLRWPHCADCIPGRVSWRAELPCQKGHGRVRCLTIYFGVFFSFKNTSTLSCPHLEDGRMNDLLLSWQ